MKFARAVFLLILTLPLFLSAQEEVAPPDLDPAMAEQPAPPAPPPMPGEPIPEPQEPGAAAGVSKKAPHHKKAPTKAKKSEKSKKKAKKAKKSQTKSKKKKKAKKH